MNYMKLYDICRKKLVDYLQSDLTKMDQTADEIGICMETLVKIVRGQEGVRHHTLLKIENFFVKKGMW